MKNKKTNRALGIFLRVLAVLGVTLLMVVGVLYGALVMIVRGPSEAAKELFVYSMKETSVGGILVDITMTRAEIEEMMGKKESGMDAEMLGGQFTDPSKIVINANKPQKDPADTSGSDTSVSDEENNTQTDRDDSGITTVPIKTDAYKGTMMIIDDPSRLFVGVPDKYGEGQVGLSLRDMIRKYDAVGGVNGGGFLDEDGMQKGGIPKGLVIKDSQILWGDNSNRYSICGFDSNGILYVGSMTARQAVNAGVVDAVSFGPALIVNGEPVNSEHYLGVSRNPRTAVGQRADGAILLVVIEGRSMSSFGATFDDLIEIFLRYGAVNATNLDGGYSSLMVYEGGDLTMNSYAYGERILPNAILIKKK